MVDSEPDRTQRDVANAVAAELTAAGFKDADEIGRGGFGIVYRCTQVALDRTVAVKVLTAELGENRERFVREQRAMGRLTGHPNIVEVLEVGGTESGYPYVVMSYHARGSLDARIRRLGPLPLQEALRLGVKLAGALETAHRLGILHRDVKPANVLLTDYDEPALSDFGIAHIPGGFTTAAGTFTGSPAFTAPEILGGDPPSPASDVYGLGATLFSALTGHAAFECRSGEQVVAQFLRIATEPAPDLRGSGIPDDVSALVERAMSLDPTNRPCAIELGEEIQRAQASHGLAVDEMALHAEPGTEQGARRAATPRRVPTPPGNLPLELTSFIGRRAELSETKDLLSLSRLVTLTGIGGVGKTRLALRAASESGHEFSDGVWLVELGDLRDGSLLVDVVAASLGVLDRSARPLREVLIKHLSSRELLLVLDNCEQVVDSAAELAEKLLRRCPKVRILATSREALNIGGESVLRLSPLAVPDPDTPPTVHGLPDYDAVALFAERVAAAAPGFTLTNNNAATVAEICSRVDGLPLVLELAAARLRTLSLDQMRERLADRYTLLTRGSRTAPARQQTMRWSVGWSYDLCTPAEQQLWGRLSVFAGSFELEAAEDVCGHAIASENVLDLVSSLVDKSILVRTESNGIIRFRLLDTLREYGAEQIRHSSEYTELSRRHVDWYRRLAAEAAAEWFSSRQIYWFERLEREMPNVREALEFSLAENGQTALEIVVDLYPIWILRGMLSEGRRWLDRALASTPRQPTSQRVKALCGATVIAELQGDLPAGKASVAEARALAEQMNDPLLQGHINITDGIIALVGGEFDRASACFEDALSVTSDPTVQTAAALLLGLDLEFRGDTAQALRWQEKALALSKSLGDSALRGTALWSIGMGWWRAGKAARAELLLKDALRAAQQARDLRNAAACLEALAWIAGEKHNHRHAVVLMGAADALGSVAATSPVPLPHLQVYHDECARRAGEALDTAEFEAAREQGASLTFEEAVAFALGEQP
jgi:non-specific serine/threonine protein kinase